MNKVIAQAQVFELIKQKYKNQGNITSDDIYNILNSYGLTEEDKQLRVKKNLFDFKGTIKTKGILTDDDIHFVPFSSDISNDKLETAYKMYIPVSAKNLKHVYYSLRNYMRKESIESNSKARNRAASDDIVIRVSNVNDVEKIRNYIKKEKSISNSIIECNPFFAHDELGIGYSMDGLRTSVNDELSSLLYNYTMSINIENISRDGFKKYLHDLKTKVYREYPDACFFQVESDRIRNLIELSMNEDFDYKQMIKYASVIQNFKSNLKVMSIRNICGFIIDNMTLKHNVDDVINILCNIDTIDESYFDSSFLYMLSKIFLNGDIVVDYFNSVNREDLERNNKKYV
ncbi:MAG: hypothetical protein IJH20_01360 [Bacilli bacterium]|nr:hypothetical protein [Bacilli bacterium]